MSEIIVCKFGGSSLSNAQQFKRVKEIVMAHPQRRIVVPSAPGKGPKEKHKVTDLLLMCYQLASHHLSFDDIFNLVRDRFLAIRDQLGMDLAIETDLEAIHDRIGQGADYDYCASRGEYLNGKLLAEFLGYNFMDAAEVIGIHAGDRGRRHDSLVRADAFEPGKAYVVPGFYGVDEHDRIKTFSRGGSDITGALLAAALNAALYENWTDVSGFMMADPRIVKNSLPIETITYRELRELSYMGAPVLHEAAVFPVKAKGIPIRILNTNRPQDTGTLIIPDQEASAQTRGITGIAGKQNYTVVRVEKTHMSEDMGFYRKLISVFETNDIQIEHMPTSVDTVSVVVPTGQIEAKEHKIREEIDIYCNPDAIVFAKDLAIIAVVGRGMIEAKGTSARIFSALAREAINIRMISQGSGELNIIIGVQNSDFDGAIRAIYHQFKEENA